MPPELDLDPERLHVHSRRLTAVVDALVPLPAPDISRWSALASTDAGRAMLAEVDRSAAAVVLAVRELVHLAAQLAEVASAARTADSDAALIVARLHREVP